MVLDEFTKRALLGFMRQAFERGYQWGYSNGRLDVLIGRDDSTPPPGFYEPEDDGEGNEVIAH